MKSFGQLNPSDPVLDGYHIAMKFFSNFQFFSSDMVPPPKLVSRSLSSPTISSRGIFCKSLPPTLTLIGNYLVETSSPKLESYIQDHLFTTLSELESQGRKDADLDPPSIDESTPSNSTPISNTVNESTAIDIESEPLDVLFLVCVEAMLYTKAQLSDPISITSPQMVQVYFQSNLQDSEADYHWMIEKIIVET